MKNKQVNLDQIAYFQASENYCFLVWPNGKKLLKSRTLKTFEPKLEAIGWCRIHRSYMVNPEYVNKNNHCQDYICLQNGIELPIARRQKQNVKKWKSGFLSIL
jgi:two-component system, LytTR family, response regulator